MTYYDPPRIGNRFVADRHPRIGNRRYLSNHQTEVVFVADFKRLIGNIQSGQFQHDLVTAACHFQ